MNLDQQKYEGEWIGPAVYGWSLNHWNHELVARKDAMAAYHEVAVSLSGSFSFTPHGGSEVIAKERGIITYTRGSLFEMRYGGELGAGKMVGFGVPSAEHLGVPEFRFAKTLVDDASFVDFAVSFLYAKERGAPLPQAEVEAALRNFVTVHGEVLRPDAIARVKLEIDRNPAAPLYLAHLAEMATMKPDTFSRAFARRYGLSPIAYRVRRRLVEAGRLLIEAPEMLVSEIAARVGFDDVRNFHRAFRQRCGMSPVEFRVVCGVSSNRRSGSTTRS